MKLTEKLSLEGKATIGTALVLFPGMEGLMHMGSAGLYLASAGTLLAFLHGRKVVRAAGYVRDRIVIGSGSSSPQQHIDGAIGSAKKEDGAPAPLSILLGHDKRRQEVRRLLSELKSILILGLPGQGKSSTAAWLISQIIELGGCVSIIDRHARSDDSLSAMLSPFEAAFINQPAYTPELALATLDQAEQLLNARMDGDMPSDIPYVLVIDEMTDLLKKLQQKSDWGDVARKLADVVEGYNAMGRKYNCFVLAIGQLTNATRTGGTEIRELFTTRLIHGMQESQARLVLPKEIASLAPRLQVGEIIAALEGKEEPFQITVPRLTDARKRQIAASLVDRQLFALEERDEVDTEELATDELTLPIEKTPRLVEIGKDNQTKQPVYLSADTFDLFVSAARSGNPISIKTIQAMVNCSEQHAKNIANMVKETA